MAASKIGDTDAIMHVSAGTLMGNFLRRFWVPFFPSKELIPGGPVKRVRLLGEDLIVYRSSAGRIGLVAENCAHRGASLFYGRNDECGLQCVWHGWAYDQAGFCIEMPNEPPDSRFKEKVRITAYPCVERNGLVWTYMGPEADSLPALPNLRFNTLPEDHSEVTFRVQECNYTVAIEGEYDSSHALILHKGLPGTSTPKPGTFRARINEYRQRHPYPKFQALDTDYGVLIGARYDAEEEGYYWRIYPFLMPFYTVINVDPTFVTEELLSGHVWVPMDDYHTLAITFTWHPNRPLMDTERERIAEGPGEGVEGLHPSRHAYEPRADQPFADWWTKYSGRNNFMLDYEAQRAGRRWSGIPGLWPQDAAMQEGLGALPDRSSERLGAADLGQIAIRRRLMRAAVALEEDGQVPSGAIEPDLLDIRPVQALLPREADRWHEAIEKAMREHNTPAVLNRSAF